MSAGDGNMQACFTFPAFRQNYLGKMPWLFILRWLETGFWQHCLQLT
jgi:hypothetical protein